MPEPTRVTEYGIRVQNPNLAIAPEEFWDGEDEQACREGLSYWPSAWNPQVIRRVVRYGQSTLVRAHE